MALHLEAETGPRPEFAVETVGEVLAIPVDQIDATDRIRPIDVDWATRLGEMMLVDGQRTPIEVCRLPGRDGFKLIAGGHRHEAFCIFPELGPIRAIVCDADRLSRRVAEISENLHRKDLEPIDRATFLSELVVTKKLQRGIDPTKDGRSASIAARWQQQLVDEADDTKLTMSLVYGWNGDVADQVGLSVASVKRDLMLIRRLQPASIDALRAAKHPILTNAAQLRSLAKQDPDAQAATVTRMCGGAVPLSLADAMKASGSKPVQAPDDKRLAAFTGAFSRMGLSEKKGALAHFMDDLPAGFVLLGVDRQGNDSLEAVRDGLDAAFKVLVGLVDGEGVDDDQIADATGAVQSALMTLGGGK